MDDPIFRKRAKLAERMNTHPYDKRILALDDIRLFISYKQIMKDEERDVKEDVDVHNLWAKKIDQLFTNLYIFTNHKMYQRYQENKELSEFREEVRPEDFHDIWEDILASIPNEVEVEEEGQNTGLMTPEAPEEDREFFTGFMKK